MFRIFIVTWAGLVLAAGSARAVYLPGSSRAEPAVRRVIVKYRADYAPPADGRDSRGGRAVTGMQQVDRVLDRFEVTSHENLVRPARTGRSGLKRLWLVDVPAGGDAAGLAAELSALPQVEYAVPDYPLQLFDVLDDPLLPYQWSLNNTAQQHYEVLRRLGLNNDSLTLVAGVDDADIDAAEVFAARPDHTAAVVVAIIDTGVDYDHPDLAGAMWTNPGEIPDNGIDDDHNGFVDDIHGWDFSANDVTGLPLYEDNDPRDLHGHGTHCAGIVASTADNMLGIAGICDSARIMAIKIHPIMSASIAVKAIVYATDNGAKAINMSWGTSIPLLPIEDAVNYAREHGVIPCAAAGNDGGEWINYPAGFSNALSVSATTSADRLASFSTYNDSLDLAAPGQSILSLRAEGSDIYAQAGEPLVHIVDDKYYVASGTSMSAPHVTAVAAYMRAVSAGLTADTLEALLRSSTDDILDPLGTGDNLPGWDRYTGYGRLNVARALEAVPKRRANITWPPRNLVTSGEVPIAGYADGDDFTDYTLAYGHGREPDQWTVITQSSEPVTDGPLGVLPDVAAAGAVTLRLSVGAVNVTTVTVYLTNDQSVAIDSPTSSDSVNGTVDIIGSCVTPGFKYGLVQSRAIGVQGDWSLVDTLWFPLQNERLAGWTAPALVAGRFQLRVSAVDDNGVAAADTIEVYVRSPFAGENGWRMALPGTQASLIPNYGDFDGDGTMEIVVGTSEGLRFYDAGGNQKDISLPLLADWDFGNRSVVAVGNLDGDGRDDIAVLADSLIFAVQTAGTVDLHDVPLKVTYGNYEPDFLKLFMRDYDSDGFDEIFCGDKTYQSDSAYVLYMFDPEENSSRVYRHGIFPADLDRDDHDEIYGYDPLVGLLEMNTSGIVLRTYNVNPVGGFWDKVEFAAVDIDTDGERELVMMAARIVAQEPSEFYIFAFEAGLQPIEGWPREMNIDRFWSPRMPVFGDFDGDGELEYVTTYFDATQGYAYAWNIDGTPYARDENIEGLFAILPDPGQAGIPLLADVAGDGRPDIVISAQRDLFRTFNQERLIAWSADGAVPSGWPIIVTPDVFQFSALGDDPRTPVIADLDGDGQMDLFHVTQENNLVYSTLAGVEYDTVTSPCPYWRYNRRMDAHAPLTVEAPPPKLQAAPPAPDLWIVDAGRTWVTLRWNGLNSETALDPKSGVSEFEGYTAYLRSVDLTEREAVASYDRTNYLKKIWIPAYNRFEIRDLPFTREELSCLYGNVSAPCSDPSFDPLSFTETNPYRLAGYVDSVFAFESYGENVNEVSGPTPVHHAYPEQPYPSSLDPLTARPDELTADGHLKYFEYECTLYGLWPSIVYDVSVAAIDRETFPSRSLGQESRRVDNLIQFETPISTPQDYLLDLSQWRREDGGNDHWYAINMGLFTWQEADSLARSVEHAGYQGHLATISSRGENLFILDALLSQWHQPTELDAAWLGAREVDGQWPWVTGEPFVFDGWTPGQPNNFGADAAMVIWGTHNSDGGRPAGEWNDLPPVIGTQQFKWWSIVEFGPSDTLVRDTLINMAQWPESAGGNGHWYGIIALPLAWSSADSLARTFVIDSTSGYLATVSSGAENDFIYNELIDGLIQPSHRDQFWLGATYHSPQSIWFWTDGLSFTSGGSKYTNWYVGQPSTGANGSALAMFGPTTPAVEGAPGKWNSVAPGHSENRWWAIVEWPVPGKSTNQPLPTDYELTQNYPNPFNNATRINYSLPRDGEVTIEIFNGLGQRVRTLLSESKPAGTYSVTWDGTDAGGTAVATGVYFYRLSTDGFRESRKMLLLK